MNNQMNKFSKFSSSGAHVSSIQNIGITSMHTQSRDALVLGGPVHVPGSHKQSSDNISRIKPVNLQGAKGESDNSQLQLFKYQTQIQPPDHVEVSEQDLTTVNNKINTA